MTHCQRQKNQGVALITAMLIVALASIAAVAVVSRQQFDIRRSANLLNGDQAYQLALGAEAFAKQILARDLTKGSTDDLKEDWAKPIQALDVEGGKVSGYIEDLQGRYNLNNLVDKDGVTVTAEVENFQRLLAHLDIPTDLAYVVADWIDKNIDPDIHGGAEDTVYTGLQPAYRPPNTLMSSVSELRLMLISDQFKPEYYAKLEPFVCALPAHTKINVNTAKAEVLLTLSSKLDIIKAQNLVADVKARAKDSPFDLNSFSLALTSIGGLDSSEVESTKSMWAVSSSYFLIAANTLFGKGQVTLYSELNRSAASAPTPSSPGKPNQISVIYRAQGVL